MQKKSKPRPRKIISKEKCYFCETNKSPNYLEVEELKKYISERGKILNRAYTGICNKHQKQLALSIKRARHLSLLPFKGGI